MIAILTSAALVLAASFPAQNAAPPSRAAAVQVAGSFEQLSQAASQAQKENRDDAAIDLYEKALKLKPEWPDGLWNLGTLQYEKGNYVEARTVLRRFMAQYPGNGFGLAILGLCEFETREYTRALDHLQQSIVDGLGKNMKLQATVSYVIAILLTRSEQYDPAMSMLFTLAASGANTHCLIEPLGLAALHLPFLPNEIPANRREMVQIAGKAVVALQEQRYADASNLFSELEAKYPDQPGVHFLVGVYLLGVSPDDGIKELKQEIEISPSHVPARLRLAEEYIKRQEPEEAVSLARGALKIEPKDGLAHMVLGEALMAKGDSAGGIHELETARDTLPDEVQIRWDLFRAYTDAGRTEDASREKTEIERLSKQDTTR